MDKGKVRVDDLFRVCGEVEVYGRKVYLRTLTEAQDSTRVEYALEGARALRKKLRSDEGNKDHRFRNVLEMNEKELRDLAVMLHRTRMERTAINEVLQGDSPEPPENPSLGDVMDAMDANEEARKETERKRREWVDERVETFKNEIAEWGEDRLREWVRDETIASICDAEFATLFTRATIALCCYRDPEMKKPYFSDIDSVREASQRFHDVVLRAYRELDRFSFDGADELKN